MSAWWVPMALWVAGAAPTPTAETQTALAITWSAPEVCPLRQRFEAELLARTPRIHVTTQNEQPGATLDVRIARVGQRFVATSKLRVGFGGLTVRELKSASCETLIGALSLTVALLIDPGGARTGALSVEELAPPPPPEKKPEPEPAPEVKPEPPVAAAEPTPAPPPVVVEQKPPPPPPADSAFELLVHGGLTGAPSGVIEAELGLTASLDSTRVRGQLSALFLPGRRFTSSVGTVEYRALGGRFDLLGQLHPLSWLTLAAGPQVSVLAMPIVAPEAEQPLPGVALLVAPGLLAQARVKLGPWRIALEGGAGVHLVRGQFLVDGVGTAFLTPVVFGQLGLSAGRAIP